MKIKTELNFEYRDAGPWRSYTMETYGIHHSDLLDNCMITEIDQDGGDIRSYDLFNAPHEIIKESLSIIEKEIIWHNEKFPGEKDMQIEILEKIIW